MKINNLRASSIGEYHNCEFKYYLHYDLGLVSTGNAAAEKGTLCHLCLELMAKAKRVHRLKGKRGKPKGKRVNPEYLLDIVFKRFQKNSRFNLGDEEKEFCRKQVQNALAVPFINPLNLKVLRTEHQFEITIKKPGFLIQGTGEYLKLRGTIDLITEQDKNTIHIIDYKTGKSTDWITGEDKTHEKLKTDTQLRMYDLAIKYLYPKYKNRIFTLFFTQESKPVTISYDSDEWIKTLEEFRGIFKQIQSNNNPTRLIDIKVSDQWKCNYVCQFGELAVKFQSDNGQIIIENFRKKKGLVIPEEIVRDNISYKKLPGYPETICQKYYKKFNKLGMDEFRNEMTQLTINGKVSARNDYSNPKLTRLEIT
jgi:Holliday junction resolvase-like predicted endonuclease